MSSPEANGLSSEFQRFDGVSGGDCRTTGEIGRRFRPIMMTTMAALMGTLPIAIGFGAGADSRRGLGLAVVGGLLFSQIVTLYITPVYYVYLDQLQTKFRKGPGGTKKDTHTPDTRDEMAFVVQNQ